eukprot:GGOE01001229.1.p1 GENE.GGOE01001229.1~~GGOE01001229.1.p1  ORF type:complete len:1076 (-),score=230.93 GGOE01001229.1:200-3427(-)
MASSMGLTMPLKRLECLSVNVGCSVHDCVPHLPHQEVMVALDEVLVKDISKKQMGIFIERSYGLLPSTGSMEEPADLALDQELRHRSLFHKAKSKNANYALFGRTVQERKAVLRNHQNAMEQLTEDIHKDMLHHKEQRTSADPSAWWGAASRTWPGSLGRTVTVEDAGDGGSVRPRQTQRKRPTSRKAEAEILPLEFVPIEEPPVSELYGFAAAGDVLQVATFLDREGSGPLLVPAADGSYPIHAAASSRSPACISLLIDRHLAFDRAFDPQQLTDCQGKAAPARVTGDPDCLAAFQGAWSELSTFPTNTLWTRPRRLGPLFRRLDFLALLSPLLAGDLSVHFQRHQVSCVDIIEGLYSAEELVRRRHPSYVRWQEQRQQWAEALTKTPHALWRTHFTAATMANRLRAAFDTWSDAQFVRELLWLYTSDSFLRPAVDAALFHVDELQTHLSPFIQTLHWAVRSTPLDRRCRRTVYQCATLTEEQRAQYTVRMGDPAVDCLTLPGFAVVQADPQEILQSMERTANTLFIISPGDAADPNCCPADMRPEAAFPTERGILFPLGQQFEVLRAGHVTDDCLAACLGQTKLTTPRPAPMYVVELRAVNAFWPLAHRLLDGAEDVSDLVPLLENRVACDAALYGATHLQLALACGGLGTCFRLLRRFDDALEMHRKALAVLHMTFADDHPEVAAAHHQLSLVYYALGDFDVALELEHKGKARSLGAVPELDEDPLVLCQKAVALSRVALGGDHPDVGEAFRNLAMAFEAKGKYDAALEMYQKAQQIAEANVDEALRAAHGDHCTDLELYARAVDMCRRALGQSGPDREESRKALYRAERSGADDKVVLEVLLKALAVRVGVTGSNPADVGASCLVQAAQCKADGDYEQAQDLYQKALGLRRAALGENHPAVAAAYNLLGAMYCAGEHYVLALVMHQRAVDIYQLNTNHVTDLGHTYMHLGKVRFLQDDFAAASALYKKAAGLVMGDADANPILLSDAYSGLGLVHYTAGDHPVALRMWQQALDARRSALPEAHPEVIALYQNLAAGYRALEDVKSWRATLQKVDALIAEMDGDIIPDTALN